MKEYIIDAKDKSLGRVASEAATILMGKNTSSYRRNRVPDVQVTIINASRIKLSPRKALGKVYQRYSGYPGGRKEWTMAKEIADKGYRSIFERAVRGMLPGNKLRAPMLKRLIVEE